MHVEHVEVVVERVEAPFALAGGEKPRPAVVVRAHHRARNRNVDRAPAIGQHDIRPLAVDVHNETVRIGQPAAVMIPIGDENPRGAAQRFGRPHGPQRDRGPIVPVGHRDRHLEFGVAQRVRPDRHPVGDFERFDRAPAFRHPAAGRPAIRRQRVGRAPVLDSSWTLATRSRRATGGSSAAISRP